MTLKEQIPEDTALFLNEDEMAESVTYAGSAIVAIVDRGVTTRDGIEGNELSSDGSAVRAEIFVSPEDVPTPALGDEIVDESGRTWIVRFLQTSDDGMHSLICVSEENPWA